MSRHRNLRYELEDDDLYEDEDEVDSEEEILLPVKKNNKNNKKKNSNNKSGQTGMVAGEQTEQVQQQLPPRAIITEQQRRNDGDTPRVVEGSTSGGGEMKKTPIDPSFSKAIVRMGFTMEEAQRAISAGKRTPIEAADWLLLQGKIAAGASSSSNLLPMLVNMGFDADDARRCVEAGVQDIDAATEWLSSSHNTNSSSSSLIQAICDMGFSSDDAIRAIAAGNMNAVSAMEWILSHPPPPPETEVLFSPPSKKLPNLHATATLSQAIEAMGFTSQQAQNAMSAGIKTAEAAAEWLMRSPSPAVVVSNDAAAQSLGEMLNMDIATVKFALDKFGGNQDAAAAWLLETPPAQAQQEIMAGKGVHKQQQLLAPSPMPVVVVPKQSSPPIMPPPQSNFAKTLLNREITPPGAIPTRFPLIPPQTGTTMFDFKSPSPDDLVAQARQRPTTTTTASFIREKELVVLPSTIPAQTLPTHTQQQPQQTQQRTSTPPPAKPIKSKAEQEFDEQEDAKEASRKRLLTLIVVGHVDAGKSTLMGHLLYDLALVSQKDMHKFEKESKEAGKPSFKFAWVMDENTEERKRGITVDFGVKRFETKNRRVTLLDAPGHRDFIPNMIAGAAQADAALLVVPATIGEFESAFLPGAQTREHAILINRLGVSRIVVCINKMDQVDWSEDRFKHICEELVPFLTGEAMFVKDNITILPVSGLIGDNVVTRGVNVRAWYTGPTLLEAIDNFPPAQKPIHKPLRMIVSDTYKVIGAVTVGGKIESGVIKVGDVVQLCPLPHGSDTAKVKQMSVNGELVQRARAGDNVDITLSQAPDVSQIFAGVVICHPQTPVPIVTHFKAEVHMFSNTTMPLFNGAKLMLHAHATEVPCVLIKILATSSTTTSDGIKKKNIKLVRRGEVAELELQCEKGICVERREDLRPLSRIVLRQGDTSVAAGFVVDFL